MKVGELIDRLETRSWQSVVVRLNRVSVSDDATVLRIGDTYELTLDEQALGILARYLRIPAPYLKNCPEDYRAQTLRYWIDRFSESDTVIDFTDTSLLAMYAPQKRPIPLDRIAGVVQMLFEVDDEVHTLIYDHKTIHVDVTSPEYSVTVPPRAGMPGRPGADDVTTGGVRLLAWPHELRSPVLVAYLHRRHNNGGVSTELEHGVISLKGRGVDEVVESMEIEGTEILRGLPQMLQAYARTAEMEVPGTPLGFATQLAREHNVPVRVRDSVMGLVNQLPGDATVYDVTQAFVTVASNGATKYKTRLLLEKIGGLLTLDKDYVDSRCSTCEQLLPL